jgi:hypothetical protein
MKTSAIVTTTSRRCRKRPAPASAPPSALAVAAASTPTASPFFDDKDAAKVVVCLLDSLLQNTQSMDAVAIALYSTVSQCEKMNINPETTRRVCEAVMAQWCKRFRQNPLSGMF